MAAITTIGFDADDTLWHNERFFRLTQERFVALLAAHGEAHEIEARLIAAERRNLGAYGYGIKGFTLSMIETALEVTGEATPPGAIRAILEAGREMLAHPVETLPHARQTLETLAGRHRIVLITKGDLFDQERKLAASGLGDLFDAVEIVSEKTPETYARLFARHGEGPERAAMVGNSLKSDVLPAIAAGSVGIHVPYEITWALEEAEAPLGEPRFHAIEDLSRVPALIERVGRGG
ncbi:HAD family hydrolase [Aurantimonas sp. Leaf443]|uniref:HAD family hydrolase n=1 Tax=Aurantimonas sp. Leaf443 TaxID=1736378 RepID=UPI000700B4F8|nr:HAD family hydrolase [Aurantimonas sp. Leaf443]KQT85461.1 HAD family hydrolase [Aurantimonas sp. Leaf443]